MKMMFIKKENLREQCTDATADFVDKFMNAEKCQWKDIYAAGMCFLSGRWEGHKSDYYTKTNGYCDYIVTSIFLNLPRERTHEDANVVNSVLHIIHTELGNAIRVEALELASELTRIADSDHKCHETVKFLSYAKFKKAGLDPCDEKEMREYLLTFDVFFENLTYEFPCFHNDIEELLGENADDYLEISISGIDEKDIQNAKSYLKEKFAWKRKERPEEKIKTNELDAIIATATKQCERGNNCFKKTKMRQKSDAKRN